MRFAAAQIPAKIGARSPLVLQCQKKEKKFIFVALIVTHKLTKNGG